MHNFNLFIKKNQGYQFKIELFILSTYQRSKIFGTYGVRFLRDNSIMWQRYQKANYQTLLKWTKSGYNPSIVIIIYR